ncbi:uncharacterized protein FTJAE_1742 [Fusarium tjaetaba]|uniref:Uncharacterized protein n=1 Tax=Fusarium tjaetaba TaxID=1567544 RepID=A0A8H5SAR8_9HYPO|nr:uncharacterized protein FTJAE_1742 [Fusarium tjaetaba]KAF5647685.1 hypothetical protein FTJAE_1742 [Fusarium tjaetaba]
MDSQTSFLDLPREVRDMVYDYALQDVKFSNAFTTQTAYSPDTLPLLYVHKIISDDLQPRLYQSHAIVVPLQEPSTYATGEWSIVPRIACSRIMKQLSSTLIIEMSQTTISYYPDSDLEEDYDEDPVEDEFSWDDLDSQGAKLPQKLINDILALKQSLPALKTIKFVFWFGNWTAYFRVWEKHVEKLRAAWPEPLLKIEFNMFEYEDHDAGDGGSNWIEEWYYWAIERKRIWFQAHNFKWEDHAKGDFRGRRINVRLWQDEEFLGGDPDDRERALHRKRCEVKPLFVRTCDMDGRV